MSDERFRFQFELLDKMSGPARHAAASVNMLGVALTQLNSLHIHVRANAQASASGMESFVTKMNSAIGVARTFAGALSGVVQGLAAVGHGFVSAVLDAAKFHARSRTMLDALFHNEPGRGRREVSAAIRLGQVLPGTTADAMRQRVTLAGRGFHETGDLDRTFALQQDLAALSSDPGSDTQDRITMFLGDVRQQGYLRGEELRQFSNLHTAVGRGDLLREIGRGRGMQGSDAQIVQRVQAMVSQKQINAGETQAALERATVATTGMALGGFAHKQGTGLLGQLSNAEETPQRLLLDWFNRQESTMSSGGMSAFGSFLQKFNEYFRAGTPTAERFMGILDKLINGVFTALFGNDPTEIFNKMVGALEKMTPAIIWVAGLFPKFIGGLADGLPFLGAVFDIVTKLSPVFQFLGSIISFVTSVWTMLFRGFVDFVEYIASNTMFGKLFDKFLGAIPHVTNAVDTVTNSMQGTFRDNMEMHSPSRVMQRMGHQVTAGLALGVEGSEHLVENASSSLSDMFTPGRTVSEFSSPGRSGSGAAAGGSAALTVNFNIPETASSAQEIADAARPMLETAFAELLERMAISAGVG